MNLTAQQKRFAGSALRTMKACRTYASANVPRGQRGKVAEALHEFSQQCQQTRQQRRAARYVALRPKLQDRLHSHLKKITQAEAFKRNLHTPTCSPREGTVEDYDPARRMWLINVERRHHYSNAFGDWWVRASWLTGHDDSGYWAVQVPGTILDIEAALDWITPAAVTKAHAEGRRVIRQGDVYLVEKKRGPDHTRDLPWAHRFDPETRRLTHPQHPTITIPFPFRAYQQRGLTSTSAGVGRRGGD